MLINDTGNYKVTGVIKNIPTQSHFNFDIFVPMMEDAQSIDGSWLSENWKIYVLLKKNANVKKLGSQLNDMMEKYTGPELKSVINQDINEFKKQRVLCRCQPYWLLTFIHLYSNKLGEN